MKRRMLHENSSDEQLQTTSPGYPDRNRHPVIRFNNRQPQSRRDKQSRELRQVPVNTENTI